MPPAYLIFSRTNLFTYHVAGIAKTKPARAAPTMGCHVSYPMVKTAITAVPATVVPTIEYKADANGYMDESSSKANTEVF